MSRYEQRLDSLEERVRKHDDILRNTELATLSRDDEGHSRQNIPESSKHVRFGNEISLDAAKLQELPSEEAQTDGMAVTFVNEEDTAFFGRRTCLHKRSVADRKRPFFQHSVHASHCKIHDASWKLRRHTHSRIER